MGSLYEMCAVMLIKEKKQLRLEVLQGKLEHENSGSTS